MSCDVTQMKKNNVIPISPDIGNRSTLHGYPKSYTYLTPLQTQLNVNKSPYSTNINFPEICYPHINMQKLFDK